MWQFLVSLLLATLYPGSLLLSGVFGLVLGLLVAVFGTLVGDWVDRNHRMKGVSAPLPSPINVYDEIHSIPFQLCGNLC